MMDTAVFWLESLASPLRTLISFQKLVSPSPQGPAWKMAAQTRYLPSSHGSWWVPRTSLPRSFLLPPVLVQWWACGLEEQLELGAGAGAGAQSCCSWIQGAPAPQ